MNLWITGGGTQEPIDAVRYIGNRSTGRTARGLATLALERGHHVTLFLSTFVEQPPAHSRLLVHNFVTSQELQTLMLQQADLPDGILHAAAVSDYAPTPLTEKVASGKDQWTLVMRPLPKVVGAVRRKMPDTVMVMFKLESNITREELWERARTAARKAGADFIFANLLEDVGDRHRGWLLDPSTGDVTELQGHEAIGSGLLSAIENESRRRGQEAES